MIVLSMERHSAHSACPRKTPGWIVNKLAQKLMAKKALSGFLSLSSFKFYIYLSQLSCQKVENKDNRLVFVFSLVALKACFSGKFMGNYQPIVPRQKQYCLDSKGFLKSSNQLKMIAFIVLRASHWAN